MLSKRNQALQLAWERGYRVDESGLVTRAGRRVYPRRYRGGYAFIMVQCRPRGIFNHALVHRLAAIQRFGMAAVFAARLVRHLDGDLTNNRPDNVALGSDTSNMLDIPVEVRVRRSLRAAEFTRTCSPDTIRAIRSRHAAGEKGNAIAKALGLHKGKVSQIINGKLYRTIV